MPWSWMKRFKCMRESHEPNVEGVSHVTVSSAFTARQKEPWVWESNE